MSVSPAFNPSQVRVRYKRCPACGDISILTSPICPCCDRTFVTTARYSRQRLVTEFSPTMAPTPYVYSDASDFTVLSQRPPTRQESYRYNPLAIAAAAVGLGWLGMILNGQLLKGASVAALFLTWAICSYLVGGQSQVMLLFVAVSGIGGYLIALTDVILIAMKLKQEQSVTDWEWF